MANALLGMASVINDPRENFNVSIDRLDAMQRLCHRTFDGELNICGLCSNALLGTGLALTRFGSEMLPCFLHKYGCKVLYENAVSTLAILAAFLFLI